MLMGGHFCEDAQICRGSRFRIKRNTVTFLKDLLEDKFILKIVFITVITMIMSRYRYSPVTVTVTVTVPLPLPLPSRYRPLPFSGQRYPTLRNVTSTLPTVTYHY